MDEKHEHNRDSTLETLHGWYRFRFKLIFEGALVGVIVGFVIVAYRLMLNLVVKGGEHFLDRVHGNPGLVAVYFLAILSLAYIVKKLMEYEPLIKGSGIPQVEGYLLNILHMNWLKVLVLKFIGGLMAIGAGLSLGREGPSIQLGAAVGTGVSQLFHRKKIEERFLVTGGASAGLAAAFNAPLAGVMFALEEVHKNFSPMVLASALVAAVTGDFISKNFFGMEPVLHFKELQSLPLQYYHFAVLLGVVMAFFGVFYNKMLLKSQDYYAKDTFIRKEHTIFVPFIMAGALAMFYPQVLGGGHHLLAHLDYNGLAISALALLLLVKFVFTMFSYGSGAPGGIFLPLLVLGGVAGALYGNLLVLWFGLPSAFVLNMIVYAMLAYFTAIVRAPITGIILISEMTGSFQHFLPLTMVAIVSYLVADIVESEPIYESLLERVVDNMPVFVTSERIKTLIEAPVYMGSAVEGKLVKEIEWPKYALLVSLKRGHKEIIPCGTTQIQAGDIMVVLTNESRVKTTRVAFEGLSQCYEEA